MTVDQGNKIQKKVNIYDCSCLFELLLWVIGTFERKKENYFKMLHVFNQHTYLGLLLKTYCFNLTYASIMINKHEEKIP